MYDLETSGLNKRFDQILQFAAVRADADLNETHRFETKSRLLPHVVPSPQALLVTGHTLAEANNPFRQSHYSMVCEIAKMVTSWCPGTFLGYNSIRFDEEFLRQAFYQCLHPIFLTNTNGNARADVLNLMRAATTLHPSIMRAGLEPDGRPTHRLGAMAAANGVPSRALHDAAADVDAMLGLCRLVRAGAPELWSTFLRFSAKPAVVDFVRDEEAFAYFDYFGRPQVMHFLTRVGINSNDAIRRPKAVCRRSRCSGCCGIASDEWVWRSGYKEGSESGKIGTDLRLPEDDLSPYLAEKPTYSFGAYS
nr:exonuclease domain-containing protein [Bradyrhizobium sp. dw_411]